jgi:hypothetical protein
MGEIKTPLVKLAEGQTFTAGDGGAHVITDAHTHADILRFVVADLGATEARFIIDDIEAEATAA